MTHSGLVMLKTRGANTDESWGVRLAPLGKGSLYVGGAGLARGAEQRSSHLHGWERVQVRDDLPEMSQREAEPSKGERENLVEIHCEHWDVLSLKLVQTVGLVLIHFLV